MPNAPEHPCRQPGCHRTCKGGYCDEHKHGRAWSSTTTSSNARGYGQGWRLVRETVLREQPICCGWPTPGACHNASAEVDHIKPKSQGSDDRRENLQALCHSCHVAKTCHERGTGSKGARQGTPHPSSPGRMAEPDSPRARLRRALDQIDRDRAAIRIRNVSGTVP